MHATCQASRSAALADHQLGRFADLDQTWPVTAGVRYVVAGMGLWETVLMVLVRGDDGLPVWCPAGLFTIDPQAVPADWLFAPGDGMSRSGPEMWTRWLALWGYPELVSDTAHRDGLVERDPGALLAFEHYVTRRAATDDGSGAAAGAA